MASQLFLLLGLISTATTTYVKAAGAPRLRTRTRIGRKALWTIRGGGSLRVPDTGVRDTSSTSLQHYYKVKRELIRLHDEVGKLQSTNRNLGADNEELHKKLVAKSSSKASELDGLTEDIDFLRHEFEALKAQATNEVGHEVGHEVAVEVPPITHSWSTRTPMPCSPCGMTLHRCFPGALPSTDLLEIVSEILEAEGLTPENTIYGQSICSDEINNEAGGTARMFTEKWGVNDGADEVFELGGIGGAPYVGKTGFGAFSGHVPDGGNVMLLFGPHIGISDAGDLGKYLRHGQACKSTACGAVVGAYRACEAGRKRESDSSDMQQVWLEQKIGSSLDRIDASSEPLAELMYATYEHIHIEVDRITHTRFSNGKLVLIGGIQLNIGKPFQDHFLPLSFRILQTGKPEVDLLPKLIEAVLNRP